MDFYVRETPIDSLLEKLEAGRLGLPRFQRDFVWEEGRVLKLLTSVARRWPIGSFLVMEGPGFLQPRPVKGGPPLVEHPEFLILDGQQRMTGLYHAISAAYENQEHEPLEAKVIYYIDFKSAIEGRSDEDIFKWQKLARFRKNYSGPEEEAQNLVAPIRTVYFEARWDAWMQFVPPESRGDIVSARRRRLSGLREYVYRVPGLFLEKGIGIVPLTRIFVSVNRGSVSLDAFDLMTAKLIRDGFDLRKHWKDARDEHEEVYASFRLGGLDILRALALIVRCKEIDSGVAPLTVGGIRQDDVLDLSHEQVEANWALAVESLVQSVRLAQNEYGVHSRSLLPNRAAFFVIAAVKAASIKISDQQLESWYWAAALSQTFAQGVNTQIIKEADDLVKWAKGGPRPTTMRLADVDAILATMDEPRRRNEILTRSLQCLLLRAGALDLVDGEVLSASDYTIDITSLFNEDEAKSNSVLSYVCTKRKTRRKLRDLLEEKSPRFPVGAPESHCIDPDYLVAPARLMLKRTTAIRPLVEAALGRKGLGEANDAD